MFDNILFVKLFKHSVIYSLGALTLQTVSPVNAFGKSMPNISPPISWM